jgi:hypothetical protein
MGRSVRVVPATEAGPPPKESGNNRLVEFEYAICQLAINGCLEADASPNTVHKRLQRLRERYGWTRRFAVRRQSTYFTRIWRLE